ncbi:S10 family serine carboxypeptidase-like protein [Sphingopyxis sp.]|uniref:S10 family serine carboxypeptidase-like protein n=1 Tax=Sphingopyxis sp. TaxID=1908224 RepID=UPI002EDA5546
MTGVHAVSRRFLVKSALAAGFALAAHNVRAAEARTGMQMTRRSIRIGGRTIAYDAEAGETLLRDDKGRPSAALFTFSYIRRDAPGTGRPVIFFFGGGPGGSALSWHFLSMGPRIAVSESDQVERYRIVDNPGCLIDEADLVFIDPVGSGFSRVLPGVPERRYWGLFEDAECFARFIRAWLDDHGRGRCPVYIAGVSYGTVRAATLSHRLHALGTPLAGVILNSSVISYASTRFAPGNDLPYIYFLPSYAAVHHFHRSAARGTDLRSHLNRAEAFALERYAPALAWGERLDSVRRRQVADEMSDLVGLPTDYLLSADLKVKSEQFMADYGRQLGIMLDRSDGRVAGLAEADRVKAFRDAPPYLETPIGMAFRRYLTDELGVSIDRPYIYLALVGGSNWNYEDGSYGRPFDNVDMAVALADDMRANPRLRVMMAAGYYDLATPYFASEMVLSSRNLPRGRLVKRHYEAGHGVDRDPASLVVFQRDLRELVGGRS